MIIQADRIITGDGKTVHEDRAVYVKDGAIAAVAPLDELKRTYPEAAVKEYPGCTLLPGLIDMHVHLGYWWSKSDAASYNDFLIAYMAADHAKKALSRGVTTIRDASSPQNLCATMNNAKAQGFLGPLPRIIPSDAGLCFTGGHGCGLTGGVLEVNGPWAIRAAVRKAIKQGAQWIKLMASHRSDTPEYTQEELEAAVDECHRVNKKIFVHAGTQPSIQMCIDAGFDTIEHGTYLTVEQARQMAQKGITWVPTIIAYTASYEHILEVMDGEESNAVERSFVQHHDYFKNAAMAYKNNLLGLFKTGVKIATGTDIVYNNGPITPVAREIKYMHDYGLPALDAIRAGTKSGAEALGLEQSIGEVCEGKQADLLLVTGNPLKDIACLEQVREVFLSGVSAYQA